MKQKLTEEKAFELFNQVEFPKSLQKIILKKIKFNPYKPRANSRWKDYCLYLYALNRIFDCRLILKKEMEKKIQFISKKYDNYFKTKKKTKFNMNEVRKLMNEINAIFYAITEGFGIYLIDKKYVLKEPPTYFYDKILNVIQEDKGNTKKIINLIRSFKETRTLKELKQAKSIVVFPEKLVTIRNVLKRKDYLNNQKIFQKKNVTDLDESPKIFYKRIFKISEAKYNFKWFLNYAGKAHKNKFKYFWVDNWKLYLKIR